MILTIWKKTDKDRNCLIKIENSVWGMLSEKALRTLFHYKLGSLEITEAQAKFLQEELLKSAWNKLLDWLAHQERSEFESRDYLKKRYFHASIIEQCVSEAKKKKFLDDERYTRLLVESLITRQKSPIQIKTKLIEKRLPSTLWEPILSQMYAPEDKRNNLRFQAEKLVRKHAELDKSKCFEKCLTSLYRKGFEVDEARDVLAELIFNR